VILALVASAFCLAIDGDTIVCRQGLDRVHLRLNGIDSPEMPGHCRRNRHCVAGDPYAAKANAARLIAGHRVKWRNLGTDRYGRTIAEVYVNGVDLSCAQVRGGFAIYMPAWDNGKLLARTCR
jgi:micrococcal nuclease